MASQRHLEAAEHLRIASFGFLDEPKRLSQTMAMLTVVHAALGRTADIETSLQRFVEVEKQFRSYDGNVLDPGVRARFETILVRSIPKATLAAIPSLAKLVQPATVPATAQRKPAPAPVPQPASAPPPQTPVPQTASATVPQIAVPVTPQKPAATMPAQNPPPGSAQSSAPASSQKPAPAVAPKNPPAPAKPRVRTTAEAVAEAQTLITANRVPEAITILNEAVIRDQSRRDLRLLLLQSAILTKNWNLGAAQVNALQPFLDSEPVFMFYGAVALFESGRVAESRTLLNRALPRVARSAYVDQYASRILNARTGS